MPFTTTVVDGGLDLITAPQAVQPGRLIAVSNYEVARQRGIRRMDGFEKYDGGQSPSTGNSVLAWTTLQTTNPPFGMQIGDAMHYIVAGFPDQHGTVWFIDSTGVDPVVYVSLKQPLPYNLQDLAANPPSGGFAFFDDTTSSAYNILTAGAGAPSTTIFPPQNVTLQAVTNLGGTVLAGTYGYKITAVNDNGETTPSTEQTVTVNFGTPVNAVSLGFTNTTWVIDLAAPGTYAVNDVVWMTDGLNSFWGRVNTVTVGNTVLTILKTQAQLTAGGTPVGFPLLLNWAGIIEGAWDLPTVPPDLSAITSYNVYGRTPGAEQLMIQTGPIDGLTIPFFDDFGTIVPSGFPPTSNTTGTAESVLDNLAGNFTAISAKVQEVPGQASVNGIFWLRDQVYATRDYFTIHFQSGTNQPNVGDLIYQGASFGAATWTGYVAKLVVSSGSFGDSNDAGGFVMFYNTTGTQTISGSMFNHSQSDVLFATADIERDALAAGLYVAVGDRGATITDQSWQWCDLGWNIGYKDGVVDFVDMNVALSELNASTDQHVVTAWKVATAFSSGTQWNTGDAFDVARIAVASDGLYDAWNFYTGTPRIPSQSVTVKGFGFTDADIPSTAAITGIDIQMRVGAVGFTGHYTAGTQVLETNIQLGPVNQGSTPNLANLSGTTIPLTGIGHAPTTPTGAPPQNNPNGEYSSYAWVTKEWGAPLAPSVTPVQTLGYSLIPIDVTSSSFGLTFGYTLTHTGVQQIQVGLDYVAIRFSYLPQTNFVYFWNSTATTPTAVKAQIVMHYQQGGSLSLSSASGTIYFAFVQSDGSVGGLPSRPVGSDEQIRSWPAGGLTPDGGAGDGSLLMAHTATSADMNVMDWSTLLQGAPQPDGTNSPPSKYQSVSKNFFASSGLEAIYGVSGGGPGFYYDGVKTASDGSLIPGNFSRILTGLPLQFETPRSVEAHQGHIFFGYFSGVIEWSNAENTLSFDPALYDGTAGDNGFGERVIGIKSINGDSLCVWTQSTVQMMQGNFNVPPGSLVTSSLYTTTISPTSGGIEYTIQPMANYMYCDFRGITAIGATQKYGDFELGHYSSVIAPWIIPRVQLSSFFEGPNIGIINSVLIRNKNMARYFFADGAALSMTFLEDNEPPQFTIQNYVNGSGVPLTWDVVQAFTERLGRDRIFGATADGTGFVYELERANSFNDWPITAFANLVPDTAQVPYQNKIFKGINVFGQAQDYAQFTLSRSADYIGTQQATGMNVITETFGALTATPTGYVAPFVSYGDAPLSIEGTAVNLRFDSSSREQFPHTIQAVSYTVKPAQEKQE